MVTVWVVGVAGLLDGRRATTHWYFLKQLRDEAPTVRYVADRRLVIDGAVATTTGITASMPMMIEAIAGRTRAEAVAREIGLEQWDARHASGAFRLARPFAMTVLANRAWHPARAGQGRGVACAGRGCLVADLPVECDELCRFAGRSGNHERRSPRARPGGRGLAGSPAGVDVPRTEVGRCARPGA